MAEEKFWIVEFRFPQLISEAASADEAASKAARQFEKEYGVNPSKWFARVFKYGKDAVGPVEEHFFNPAGIRSYVKDKNYDEHKEIIDGQNRNGQ